MGRVISIASQKGGVGKTTTTVNLGACLSQDGKRVLIVDIDPQGNATSGLGISGQTLENTVYEVLVDDVDIKSAIVPTALPTLDLLPANQKLSGAEVELVQMMARETRLRTSLAAIKDDYDYILIDSPPSLGLLTVNSLTASEGVIIPLQCEYLALEGLTQLWKSIQLVQSHLNPEIRVVGVLLTMYDARLNLTQSIAEDARKTLGELVYKTVIPRNVKLSEAPSFGKPITLYDPNSTGAESYRDLAREVQERD